MTYIDYAPNGEDFLNSLDISQYHDTTDIEFDIDNEYIIADLCEVAIWVKGALKTQSKSIVIFKNDKIEELRFKFPFTKIINAGKGDIIKTRAKKLEDDGYLILNTNLVKLGIL